MSLMPLNQCLKWPILFHVYFMYKKYQKQFSTGNAFHPPVSPGRGRRRSTLALTRALCSAGDFPTPAMAALPGAVVPWNGSVRLRCRGAQEAFLYQLWFLGTASRQAVEQKLGFQEEAEFLLPRVDASSAGRYQCQYRRGHRWSEESPALRLVVTGEQPF